ncbi:MAG TPA: sodium:solute symporter, partial [Candidatus Hydrogenedentes bacterium]|nr:sodium:solute symporter [Candidatus Hydrogenedentota bacterium]
MLDATIIALYLAVMLGVGFMVSRRGGEDDFFLAGRAMPSWAVSLSVVATALSAATFVGVPQLALTGNLSYLATYIGALIATALIALWFVPALYREGTLTIYGMLTRRFGESVTV